MLGLLLQQRFWTELLTELYLFTFAVRLHARRRVDGVTEETISRHFETHDSGTHWTYTANTLVVFESSL